MANHHGSKPTSERSELERPISVRLPAELVERLDAHAAMRLLVSERVTRSDLIREALVAYLDGFDESLRADLKEMLSTSKR